MGRKGGYLGGSTTFRTNPELSGRKNPKKGALDSWVKEAQQGGVPLPEDIRLKPLGSDIPNGVKKIKKKKPKNTRRETKSETEKSAQGASDDQLPDYEDLLKALREKYSK